MKLSRGHLEAFFAYFTWGVFPIYWKYLAHLSSAEILVHRIIWSFVFVTLLTLLFTKTRVKSLLSSLISHRWAILSLSLLIATNWMIYVYAVNSNQILQGSLAYFITPLLNILLGSILFQERLSKRMHWATGVAGAGVLILIVLGQSFPWIALSLAFSFSLYGVIKKKISLGGMESTALENGLMLFPAAFFAFYFRQQSQILLTNFDWVLLVGSGVVTATPILLFSLSARKIPFNHMGILQFLAPSLQFLVGFLVYNEPLGTAKIAAFLLVWLGVSLYVRDILRRTTT